MVFSSIVTSQAINNVHFAEEKCRMLSSKAKNQKE